MTSTRLPDLTMPQMLREHARQRPHELALRQKDYGIWQPMTWADYYRRARHFGLGLKASGLGPDGRVAIIAENRAEWVIAQMGIGLVHGIVVGVYPTSPWNEVAYVLGHSDAELVICEDQEQTDKVVEAWNSLPCLTSGIVIDMKGLRHYERERLQSFAAVEELGANCELEHPGMADELLDGQSMDDTAFMIYTSGSTGRPKGAMISWRNLRAAAPGIVDLLSLNRGDGSLSYLPLCHIAEQLTTTIGPLYVGSTVSFGESLRTVQEDLREIGPSYFLGVPRIWEKLHSAIYIKIQETGRLRRWLLQNAIRACEPLGEKPRQQWTLRERLVFHCYYIIVLRALLNFIGLRRSRVAMSGAAPIAKEIVRFFRGIGVPLIEVYGSTEATGIITGQQPDDVIIGTVGVPVSGVEVKLSDQGELLVHGGTVFQGYYKNDQATVDTIRDGWLYSGDVAELTEAGHYRIVDRLKDIMITAGGKNLSPSEIENTIKASPYIKECIAIGESRSYVSALIQIDYETVAKWAEGQRIAYTTFRSLADNPHVEELIQREIDAGNARLPNVARLKRFYLLTKELDHDDDEVTATMKVRRSSIQEKYADAIESLYS